MRKRKSKASPPVWQRRFVMLKRDMKENPDRAGGVRRGRGVVWVAVIRQGFL